MGFNVFSRAIRYFKRAWNAAPIATAMLVLALVASVYFGVRSATHPMRVEREQDIAAWMTPRYIVRSWSVPPEVILNALDLPRPPPDGPMSLAQLAAQRGVPVEQIIAEAEAAIAAFRQDGTRPDEGSDADD